MLLTTKRAFFLFLMGVAWFLLLLVSDQHHFFLFGLIILGLSFFLSEVDWPRLAKQQRMILAWLFFLSVLGLSALFTISFPLTLKALSRYAFVFSSFWFIYLLKKSFVSTKSLLKLLILLGFSLVLINFISSSSLNWLNFFSRSALLKRTHGHSHLGTTLLLFLPLAWWLLLTKLKNNSWKKLRNKKDFWISCLILLFLNLTLLTSFGRVAVLLGFCQLLVITSWFSSEAKIEEKLFKKTKLAIKVISSVFVMVLLLKSFFSAVTLFKPNFKCPIPALEKELCKPILGEPRPQYWGWALEIIKDKPWLGSGPGTFELESQKYHLSPNISVPHTHNSYLRALSELGLIGGGIFISLMFYLLFKAYQVQKESEPGSWQRAVFLGLVAIYLNAFFDFDWQFIGVFSLTFVLLALLIREEKTKKTIQSQLLKTTIKTSFLAASLYLIIIASLYAGTEVLIRSNKVSSAFKLFPYIHWQLRIYEQDPSLSDQQRQKLLSIYKAHPDIYRLFINSSKDADEQQQLRESWAKLDPWQLFNQDLASYYLKREEPNKAAEFLLKSYEFVKRIEATGKYEFEHQKKLNLSQQMLELADLFYQKNEPKLASYWYLESRFIDDWQLAKHRPVFLTQDDIPFAKQLIFFNSLTDKIPAKFFGQYRADYAQSYQEALVEQLKAKDQTALDNLVKHSTQIINLDTSLRQALWQKLAKELLAQSRVDLANEKVEASYDKLTKLAKTRTILSNNDQEPLDWSLREELGRELIRVGDQLLNYNLQKALDAYQAAGQLITWIFDVEPHWLQKVDLDQLTILVLKDYFHYLAQLKPEEFAWQTERRTQLAMTLIKKLVESNDLDQALTYTNKTQEIKHLDYQLKKELVVWLQTQALESVKTDDFNSARIITRMMTKLMPDDYWVAVQPAHLYLAQKDYKQAKEAYQACLNAYQPEEDFRHDDCWFGLKSLEDLNPNHGRYLEVAEIIQEN